MESSFKRHFKVYSEIVSAQLKGKKEKLKSERKELYENMLRDRHRSIDH